MTIGDYIKENKILFLDIVRNGINPDHVHYVDEFIAYKDAVSGGSTISEAVAEAAMRLHMSERHFYRIAAKLDENFYGENKT